MVLQVLQQRQEARNGLQRRLPDRVGRRPGHLQAHAQQVLRRPLVRRRARRLVARRSLFDRVRYRRVLRAMGLGRREQGVKEEAE